jgi:uncharacterized protein
VRPTLPPLPDVDSAPFWEALRAHQLQVQRCRDCGRLLFPARPICAHCTSGAVEWVPVSGRGRVLSWVVTHQVFNKVFADNVPYTTVLVQLEEQPDLLMYGNLADVATVVRAGLAVQAVFDDHDEGFTLVQWAAR